MSLSDMKANENGLSGVTILAGAKPTLSYEASPLARSLMRSKPALSLCLFSHTHLFLSLTAKAGANRERRSLSVGFAPASIVTPDGAGVVEAFQSCMPRLHIGKPTQPDKLIRMVAIAKLTDNVCAISLLLFDEMLIKQGDEIVAQTRLVDILTQFYDWAPPLFGLLWRLSRACADTHLRLCTCI